MTTILEPKYTNGVALTITLASLASTTADPPVGRESTIVDNSSTRFLDAILSGQITTGTSPTASKQIVVCVWGITYNGTNTRPPAGVAATGDAALTPAFAGCIGVPGLIMPAIVIPTTNTSDKAYAFAGISVRRALRLDTLPYKWGAFVYHSTGQNLNATGGNHFLEYTGLQVENV
jgi:hypothetical protein